MGLTRGVASSTRMCASPCDRYVGVDTAARAEDVCDADNNAPCSRSKVEAFAEDLRTKLAAAEEEGTAAFFHTQVALGRGGHATHFWPLLFDLATGEILANGRNASYEGDIAEGSLSIGKSLDEWVLDMTRANCAAGECTEADRRFFVPAAGVPGTDCRLADQPGAGFCVSDEDLNATSVNANTYTQRFRNALMACEAGSFVYLLMPSTLTGGQREGIEEEIEADEWVFYAAAPTPAGTVVAYGYRNVPHAPVLPCNAGFNGLCSIANSVSLAGAALDAVGRASTPWEFENALNRITFDPGLKVPGGFYVFSYHFNGVNVAHGASRKNVGRSTEAIVRNVSPRLNGPAQNALLASASAALGGSWATFLWPTLEAQQLLALGLLNDPGAAASVPKVAYMHEYEALVRGVWQQFYLGVGYNHAPIPERCTDVWTVDLGNPVNSAVNCSEADDTHRCSSAFAAPCAVSNTLRLVGDVATEMHTHDDADDFLNAVASSDRFNIGQSAAPFDALVVAEEDGALKSVPRAYPKNYTKLQDLWTIGFGLSNDTYACFLDTVKGVANSQFGGVDTGLLGGWVTTPWGIMSDGKVLQVTDHTLYARGFAVEGKRYFYLAGFGSRARPEGSVTSFDGRQCGWEHRSACTFSNTRLATGPLLSRVLASSPDPDSSKGRAAARAPEASASPQCTTAAYDPDGSGSGTRRRRLLAGPTSGLPLLNDTFALLTSGDLLKGTSFENARIYVLRMSPDQTKACVVASTIDPAHVTSSVCQPLISTSLGSIRPEGDSGDSQGWIERHVEAANSRDFEEDFRGGYATVRVSYSSASTNDRLRVYVQRVRAGADGQVYLIATGVPDRLPFRACGDPAGCPDHSSCSDSIEQEFCVCEEGFVPVVTPTQDGRSGTSSCELVENDSGDSFPAWAIGLIVSLGVLGVALCVLIAWYRRRRLRQKYESAWMIDSSEVTAVLERGEPVPLGAGTFGAVYLGRFRGTLVALKRVRLSSSARTGTASSIDPLPASATNGGDGGRQKGSSLNASGAEAPSGLQPLQSNGLQRARSRVVPTDSALSTASGASSGASSPDSPAGSVVASPDGSEPDSVMDAEGCSTGTVEVTTLAATSQLPAIDDNAEGGGDEHSGGGGSSGGGANGDGCSLCASVGCLSMASGAGTDSQAGGSVGSRLGTGVGKRLSSARISNIFRREIRLMVRLRHPNIVTVLGATKEAEPLLVLEYMPRGTLRDLLLNPTADLPLGLCISMVRDVCSGLRYLHSSTPPVLHGDIKSANVLVNDSFDCKLSDFGLSSTKGRTLLSGSRGGAVGTPFWMAPELLDGKPNSEASDVYGFGVLLWEVFSRSTPYADQPKGRTTQEVLLAVRSDEIKLRPTISAEMRRSAPPGIVPLIEDCLLHNPDRRPSLEEVDAALDKIQTSGASPLRKADLFDPAANTRRSMLLERLLPPDVAARLTRGEKVGALRYERASIFFCDICNFTSLSDRLGDPELVADMLHRLYSRFDALAREFGVYKVETIGDCYMVAGGVAQPQPRTHAARVAAFALAAIEEAAVTPVSEKQPELGTLQIRAGFHCGPVVGGLVGSDKLKFSVYGDTVNTASRCESNGHAQRLTTSEAGAAELAVQAPWLVLERRGRVDVKGKGSMTLYFTDGDGKLRAHLCELDQLDAADEEREAKEGHAPTEERTGNDEELERVTVV